MSNYHLRARMPRAALALATLLSVLAIPATSAAAAGSTATLETTTNGTPSSAVAENDVIHAVTSAPIEVVGQTGKVIGQVWDNTQLNLSDNSIVAPEGWALEYTTDGATWSSVKPAIASIKGVRTVGDVNALGYAGGLQSKVVTAGGSVRQATVSSISVTGLGDGWDVFFDEEHTKIFNVFHHSSPAQIDCHSLLDGSRCSGYPVTLPLSLGTNDRSTGVVVGSKVWVAAGRGSNPGGGFACFNVSGGLCTTSFVKLTSNSLNGNYSNVSNMARIDQYVFATNLNDGKILCLDSQTSAGCASMPAGGFDLGIGAAANYGSNLLTVGNRLYASDGNGEVGCLDTNTWGTCTGWESVWASGNTYQLMALPSSTGAMVAICTFDNAGAACVDSAQQPYAHPASLDTTIGLSPAWIAGYGKTPETVGTRVYWTDANYQYGWGEVSCWDASLNGGTGGTCANFPLLDENYTVTVDPVNADCIWTNDNNGSIEAFDAISGTAGCTVPVDPVVAMPYTATVPRVSCSEAGRVRSWTSYQITNAAGGDVTSFKVTVKKNGAGISGWTNLTPDATGSIDLTALDVAVSGTKPTFEVSATGVTEQDAAAITADVTFLSDAPQLCLDLVVLRSCPTGYGQAPAVFNLSDARIESTIIDDVSGSATTTTLTSDVSRASLTGCAGGITGIVKRTPPSGDVPIQNATVNILDGEGNVLETTTTDASGAYSFSNLYPNDYTVQYGTNSGVVTVPAGSNGVQDFSIPVGDPTANPVSGTTQQNVPVSIAIDAASDPLTTLDAESLQIRAASGVWGSEVVIEGEGTWTIANGELLFTPLVTFTGVATPIEYRIADAFGNYATSTAAATVAETALVANPDSASGTQGETLHLDIDAAAGAVAINPALTVLSNSETGVFESSIFVANVGSFSADENGHVTFVPVGSFSGTHSVFYKAFDAAGRSVVSTMTVSLIAVKLSGSDDIVPQVTDGSLPVTGIPQGATVELPAAHTNVKAMSFANGRVTITPTPGFSGIIRVPVTAKLGTAAFTTEVVLTVLPDASPRVKIQNNRTGGLITWTASPTPTVRRYIVRVNGLVVCETDAAVRSCQNMLPIGPKSSVTVQAVGGDETLSTLQDGKNAPKCGTIGSVSFAPDSAKLSNATKMKLREIARIVKRQGFKNLCISGHTDARRSFMANNDLSWWRAQNVYSYLNKFLPADAKVKLAFSGEHRPRATNQTQQGMAKNRRVDIALMP